MKRLPLPVDRLLVGYNLLLAGLWATTADRLTSVAAVALHLAACAIPGLLDRAARPGRWRPVHWLREGYPLVFLLVFWTELGSLIPLLHSTMNDGLITKLDFAAFGRHWNEDFSRLMPDRWLNELLFFAYLLYLPLIYLPVIVAVARDRTDAARDMSFRLLTTYVGCYLVYLVLPVLGPHDSMTVAVVPDGFFATISEAIRARGDSLGTAFPSSHAAGAVTVAVMAWYWLRPWIAALLTIQAGAVVLATVYTNNHYGIDSVTGAALALGLQLAVVPWLARLLAPGPAARPLPLLPRFGTAFLQLPNTGRGR